MAKSVLKPQTWLTPSPAVMVTCQREGEKPNIITLAWCGVACSQPPMVGVAIRPATYSHGIITDTREFVINIPGENLLESLDYCGTVSGRTEDKFQKTHLTPLPAQFLNVPLIKECPINLECRVIQILEPGLHHLFLAEIIALHADEDILDEKGGVKNFQPVAYRPDQRAYTLVGQPVGRFGFTKRARDQK